MKYILTILFFPLLFGCSTVDNKASDDPEDTSSSEKVYTALSLDEYKKMYDIPSHVTTKVEDSKTETIDFDCAILIDPTEGQIEEMKKQMGEDDFYTVADDNNWYQGTAIGLIDSLNIKKFTASERYLVLKGNHKSWTLDIRKDNSVSWNLIFFKRTKEPKVVSTVDLTIEQVKEYFETAE